MTWYAWVVIVAMAWDIGAGILNVGKERKIWMPTDALARLVLNAAVIVAIVELASR